MIQGIIFDVDDTLNKTRQIRFDAHKYCAKKFYGLKLSDEQITAHWGKPFRQFITDLYGNIDAVDDIIKNFTSIIDKFPNQAYDDAVATINALARDYTLGLLSSGHKDLMRQDLTTAGFDLTKFTFIQTSEATSVHKPDPRVFLPILKEYSRIGILPDNILYVGDRRDDYDASTGAGIHFMGIADHSVPYDEFVKFCPTVIRHFKEIPAWLEAHK